MIFLSAARRTLVLALLAAVSVPSVAQVLATTTDYQRELGQFRDVGRLASATRRTTVRTLPRGDAPVVLEVNAGRYLVVRPHDARWVRVWLKGGSGDLWGYALRSAVKMRPRRVSENLAPTSGDHRSGDYYNEIDLSHMELGALRSRLDAADRKRLDEIRTRLFFVDRKLAENQRTVNGGNYTIGGEGGEGTKESLSALRAFCVARLSKNPRSPRIDFAGANAAVDRWIKAELNKVDRAGRENERFYGVFAEAPGAKADAMKEMKGAVRQSGAALRKALTQYCTTDRERGAIVRAYPPDHAR